MNKVVINKSNNKLKKNSESKHNNFIKNKSKFNGVKVNKKNFFGTKIKNLNKKNRSNLKGINFQLIIFSIKFFLFFLFLTFILDLIDLSFLTNFLTKIVASFFNLFFKENVIFLSGSSFEITNACTGFSSVIILFSILFSFKKPGFFKKTILFFVGSIILLLINIPRLGIVIFSAIIGFDAELIHTLTWFLMSLAVLLILLLGSKYYYKKEINELL